MMRAFTLEGIRNSKRVVLLLLADALLISLALYGAFLLRFDGQIPPPWANTWLSYLWIALGVKIPIFYAFRLYRMSWAHVSFRELLSVFLAVGLSSSLLGTIFFLLRGEQILWTFPRSILILDYVLTLFLIGGLRSGKRIQLGLSSRFSSKGRRVLLVGAGNAGDQILRAMLRETRSLYLPIGFADDDPTKQGIALHGVRVLGKRSEIPQIVKMYGVEELIISMPAASSRVIRETVELGRQARLTQIKILPGLHQLVSGQLGLSDIREVQPEDLLGREPVHMEVHEIQSYLKDKVVLVTGASGSIGTELCRQIAKFSPSKLLALDQDETGQFYLEQELREKLPSLEFQTIIADIRDQTKIEQVFQQYRPQVVFHAAAYKHVPLMEIYPDEAVKNNIFGTLTMSETALKWRAEKFVLISTDKAVNPTSVMGATKRAAEMMVQVLHRRGGTKFTAVRFGNVLGSRGSVIPIFRQQIKRGGPVTVTHEDMQRYVMVASEAVALVLQAGSMSQGGEVFVLDMGDPIKIVDLARELIRLSGYEPDKDIPIVFTGQRPGEKFFEELLTAEEGTVATHHRQIFVARMGEAPEEARLRQQLGK
ncbi:MAG: hypothetical protein A2Z21_06900, partial [Candidatus Fraserbacteria bacterium RBG_16_55_9]